jgi:hypothetical protein
MARRIPALIIALVALGMLVAGCGGGGKSSDKSKSETSTQAATSTEQTTTEKKPAKKDAKKAKSKDGKKAATTPPPTVTPKKQEAQTKKRIATNCKTIAGRPANADEQKLCQKNAENSDPGAPKTDTRQLALKVCYQQVDAAGLSPSAAAQAKAQCLANSKEAP